MIANPRRLHVIRITPTSAACCACDWKFSNRCADRVEGEADQHVFWSRGFIVYRRTA